MHASINVDWYRNRLYIFAVLAITTETSTLRSTLHWHQHARSKSIIQQEIVLLPIPSLCLVDVTSSETWGPSPHFQEGVMPGFTSARRSELVIITYKLDVDTAEELARHGVTCVELTD